MKCQGVPLLIGLILFFTLLCLYLLYDPVYCIVKGAGVESLNGYFSAADGTYSKIVVESSSRLIPDVFSIFSLKRQITTPAEAILFAKGNWLMVESGKIIYHTDPAATDINIRHPPNQYWMLSNQNDSPIPSSVQCSGYSPRLQADESSNIGALLSRPVTTVLLITLCYYAYYLWKNNIEVSAVSYSYEAIIHRGEYWRIVTASFAHFDLIHLGFNCMGLYQLGLLEPIYGSIAFAYLNIALVFFTMAICLVTHYILIHRYNSTQYISQQAVGYSCVLFAWMVALSVRLVKFCPIFIFPTFCMNTLYAPLPFTIGGVSRIPFNFGPFLLLIFTQLILTRASFIGHLSGILIGYPLAWGALNFVTPIRLVLLLTIAYLAVEKLHITKYYSLYQLQVQNQGRLPPVSEVIERGQSYVNYARWKYSSILVALFMIGEAYFKVSLWDWTSLLISITFIYLAATSILCRTIMYYTSYGYIGIECTKLMIATFIFLIAVLIYQYFNLLSLWSTHRFLSTNGLSYTWLEVYSVVLAVLMLIEMVNIFYLYQMTKEIVTAQQFLQSYHWDSASLNEDWLKLKQRLCFCRGSSGNNDLELQNLEVFQQSSGTRLGNQTLPPPPSAPVRPNADQSRRERALARFEANSNATNATEIQQNVQNPLNQSQVSNQTGSSLGLGILSSLTQPGNVTTVNGVRYERIPADEIALEGDTPDPRNVIRRNSPTNGDSRKGNKALKTMEV